MSREITLIFVVAWPTVQGVKLYENMRMVYIIYLKTPFLVPGIMSNMNKKVSGSKSYLSYGIWKILSAKLFFFNLELNPGTINGVLRLVYGT